MRSLACLSATIRIMGLGSWLATGEWTPSWSAPDLPEQRSTLDALVNLSDPNASFLLGFSDPNGFAVSENTATTLSAVYRCLAVVGGSIGQLPLRTIEDGPDDTRTKVTSFLDNPGGDRFTPMEWKKLVVSHLLLHGNAYLQHIYGAAGQLVALYPVDPVCVSVEWDSRQRGGKLFTVTTTDSTGGTTVKLGGDKMTQLMGEVTAADGLYGLSVISKARRSFGTALAGDQAANRMFANGNMSAGIVAPASDAEDLHDPDEAAEIADDLNRMMTGPANAGGIVVMPRKLVFHQISQTAADAQFLESRTFGLHEIGRWFGVKPHQLGLTEGVSNWGTGIAEQNRGFARETLIPITTGIQERLTRLLYNPRRRAEFDFTAFTEPAPEDKIRLILAQVNGGLITPNEGRALLNLQPITGAVNDADQLRLPAGQGDPDGVPTTDPAPDPEATP